MHIESITDLDAGTTSLVRLTLYVDMSEACGGMLIVALQTDLVILPGNQSYPIGKRLHFVGCVKCMC